MTFPSLCALAEHFLHLFLSVVHSPVSLLKFFLRLPLM